MNRPFQFLVAATATGFVPALIGGCYLSHERTDDPAASHCDPENVPRPCDDPSLGVNEGCDLWAVTTPNTQLGVDFAVNADGTWSGRFVGRNLEFDFGVWLVNRGCTPASAQIEGGDLERTMSISVDPGEARRVLLPWVQPLAHRTLPGELSTPLATVLVSRGAYHIQSDVPVVALQANPAVWPLINEHEAAPGSASMDWTPLVAEHALGTSYVVATRPSEAALYARARELWPGESGFIAIVGTQPETRVDVRLPSATAPGPTEEAHRAGEVVTRELGYGDVWLLASGQPANADDCRTVEPIPPDVSVFPCDLRELDLTGAEISASAPVAVFAGHSCAQVPIQYGTCDHLEAQLLPVGHLGRRHVLVAFGPPTGAIRGIVRIVSPTDGNRVVVGAEAVDLDHAEWVERVWDGVLEVTSTAPVLVVQFAPSATFDDAGIGDPSMFQPLPAELWQARYDIIVPHVVQEWAGATAGWGEVVALMLPDDVPLIDGMRRADGSRTQRGDLNLFRLPLREPGHVALTSANGQPFGAVFASASFAVSIAYSPP